MQFDISHRITRFRNAFNLWCQAAMQNRLPRRSKRIIFAAAIAGRLENTDTLGEDRLVKLNAVLKLSSSIAALELPVYLNRLIWRGQSLDNLAILEETGTDIVQWSQDTVPSWLRYGRASDMVAVALVVKYLVESGWTDESVRAAKRRFRGYLPTNNQPSTYEASHV